MLGDVPDGPPFGRGEGFQQAAGVVFAEVVVGHQDAGGQIDHRLAGRARDVPGAGQRGLERGAQRFRFRRFEQIGPGAGLERGAAGGGRAVDGQDDARDGAVELADDVEPRALGVLARSGAQIENPYEN